LGQFIDLTNKKYDRLTVIKRIKHNNQKEAMWLCRCDCGKMIETRGSSLRAGLTRSCGCLQKEWAKKHTPNKTHGYTKERLYKVWMGMRQRCYLKTNNRYKHYGGRGIEVCDEWQDYLNFRKWALSHGYDSKAKRGKCTIDRIDVDGNYEPSNCRWVDAKTQANNTRRKKEKS